MSDAELSSCGSLKVIGGCLCLSEVNQSANDADDGDKCFPIRR